MKIRWIKEEEIKEALKVLAESFPVDTTEKKVKDSLNEKNRILVAVLENEIVGVVVIKKEENFIENVISFHLDNICVKPTMQNKNIASTMLQEIECIAKEEQVDYIDLTSSNYRKVAHHVYLKNGYERRESCLFRKKISDKCKE